MSAPVLPEDSSPATTTAEQNLASAGRRLINAMWERTQREIALTIAAGVILISGYIIVFGEKEMKLLAYSFLTNIGILVINTYFQRTNHTRVGGVPSPEEKPRRGE